MAKSGNCHELRDRHYSFWLDRFAFLNDGKPHCV
jgi:hypothetical protein